MLAGHSWTGTIISEAGNHPTVTALVYVATRTPDALAATFPTPPANAGLAHHEGYAQLSENAFLNDFAGGVDEARALYAVPATIADLILMATRRQSTAQNVDQFADRQRHKVPRELFSNFVGGHVTDHTCRPPGDADRARGCPGPNTWA